MTATLINCPVKPCTNSLEEGHVLCREHFDSISPQARLDVFKAKYKGVSSPQYLAAAERAIAFAQDLEDEREESK